MAGQVPPEVQPSEERGHAHRGTGEKITGGQAEEINGEIAEAQIFV
jgi:hypothetical protein